MIAPRLTLLLTLSSLAAAGADEPSTPRDRLVSRPPFAVGAARGRDRAAAPVAAPGATELRGIFGTGASGAVSLRTVGGDAHARWLRVGESAGAWRVLSVDAAKREAVVEIGGRPTTLTLAKPEIRAIPADDTRKPVSEKPLARPAAGPDAPAKDAPATTAAEAPATDEAIAPPAPEAAPKPAGAYSRRRRYPQPEPTAP